MTYIFRLPSFVCRLKCGSVTSGRAGHSSCGGPGKPSVVSEKDALRLLNLVPLLVFAERKRASKGTMPCPAGGNAAAFHFLFFWRKHVYYSILEEEPQARICALCGLIPLTDAQGREGAEESLYHLACEHTP